MIPAIQPLPPPQVPPVTTFFANAEERRDFCEWYYENVRPGQEKLAEAQRQNFIEFQTRLFG